MNSMKLFIAAFTILSYITPLLGDHVEDNINKKIKKTSAFMARKFGGRKNIFFDQLIRDGDLVFDVGANIGKKTAQYLAYNARVICFEPQPNCAEILRNQFKHLSTVTVVEKGLADEPGHLELALCPQANTLATCSKEAQIKGRFAEHNYRWSNKITIEITTLDEMIKTYGLPIFCKIDVENFEYEVLKGLSQPIRCLSFEYHIEFMDNIKKCIAHLESIGYTKFNLTIAETLKFVADEWLTGSELLATIEETATKNNWQAIWGLWGDIYAFYETEKPVEIVEAD